MHAYVRLFDVMCAVVRGDDYALLDSIRRETASNLAAISRGHRCAAALCAALEHFPNDKHATLLRAELRKDRWSARLRMSSLCEQLQRVLETMRSAALEPLLLKGAQRIACGMREAEVYASHDIDVLVSPDSVERACDALRREGYRQDPNPLLDYHRHHHAAPLIPSSGVPVEVHRALTPHPLNLPVALDDLRMHTVVKRSALGEVRVLDAVATTLHLTVHCLQRPALREIALLSRQLLQLDAYETASFRGILSREERYAVPLNAAVVLAAQMANVSWPCDARTRRYAHWMLVREDLPASLRARPECVDAWLAAQHERVKAVFSASFAGDPAPKLHLYMRAVLRLCAAAVTSIYGRFMNLRGRAARIPV